MARTPSLIAVAGVALLPALVADAQTPPAAPGPARPPAAVVAKPAAPAKPTVAPAAPRPQPVPAPVAVAVPKLPTTPGADPLNGSFTLAQATFGLKGLGALVATFEIEHEGQKLGVLTCELFADKAPVTVANFVGLARGLRPYLDPKSQQWVKRPLFDGNQFHRVIPEFMIQAGDPRCTAEVYCMGRPGIGDPGYAFANETRPELRFDRPGLLAMANRGPDTNGSQFFITERDTPWLDGTYTIFGQCGDLETIKKIAGVPTTGRDLPERQVFIKKVTISRKAK